MILLLLFFIFMAAFFSGIETGFVSLSPLKIEVISKKRPKLAEKLKSLRDNWNLFLSTTLIGNDLAVVSASSLFTLWMNEKFNIDNELFITAVFSVILLIFGESGPKVLCRYYNEKMVPACLPLFRFFLKLFYPLSWLFNKMISGLFYLLGVKDAHREDKKMFVTREELRMLLYQSASATKLHREERSLIKRIFEFSSKKASDIATPIKDVSFVDISWDRTDIIYLAREKGFSRFPVKDGEKIIGFIHILDVIYLPDEENWKDYIRPVIFMYADVPVGQVFYQMQAINANMVIVYGQDYAPLGIITMKDIMDEIVGEVVS